MPKTYEPEAMSSADLVRELTDNTTLLVQRHIELARLELKEELRRGLVLGKLVGIAGLSAYAGVIFLLGAAALAIGAACGGAYWLGALIVAALLFVPAVWAGVLAWQSRPEALLRRTRNELAKEISWVKCRTT